MGLILGIDTGLHGAIARLTDDGALIDIEDMPLTNDGPKGRNQVNAPLLADIFWRSHATRAFVEKVGTRPCEGAVGAFAFGRACGIVEGVAAAAGIPITWLMPKYWKQAVGLASADKGLARNEAIRRFPAQAALFARVKDDGRAESALIAIAGMLKGAIW